MKKSGSICLFAVVLFYLSFSTTLIVCADLSSEDVLRARVNEFWAAWSKGDWAKVESFVSVFDRELFKQIKPFPIFEYHVEDIKVSPHHESAVVKIKIKRNFPGVESPFDWDLMNDWVYEENQWVLHYVPTPPGILFSSVPPLLPFDARYVSFGFVPENTSLSHTFRFLNQSSKPAKVIRVNANCSEKTSDVPCAVTRALQSEVAPGEWGEIAVSLGPTKAAQQAPLTRIIEIGFDVGETQTVYLVGVVTPTTKFDR
jgi:hypothetical protein